jgi:hypothetical protein
VRTVTPKGVSKGEFGGNWASGPTGLTPGVCSEIPRFVDFDNRSAKAQKSSSNFGTFSAAGFYQWVMSSWMRTDGFALFAQLVHNPPDTVPAVLYVPLEGWSYAQQYRRRRD